MNRRIMRFTALLFVVTLVVYLVGDYRHEKKLRVKAEFSQVTTPSSNTMAQPTDKSAPAAPTGLTAKALPSSAKRYTIQEKFPGLVYVVLPDYETRPNLTIGADDSFWQGAKDELATSYTITSCEVVKANTPSGPRTRFLQVNVGPKPPRP